MTQSWERVKDMLIATSVMDERGLTRRPRRGHCARCGMAVIGAITDSGFSMIVWPDPTTPWGELCAIRAGLPTYTMTYDELLYRDDFRIMSNNALNRDVMIPHRCDDPRPPKKDIKPSFIVPTYDDPPF